MFPIYSRNMSTKKISGYTKVASITSDPFSLWNLFLILSMNFVMLYFSLNNALFVRFAYSIFLSNLSYDCTRLHHILSSSRVCGKAVLLPSIRSQFLSISLIRSSFACVCYCATQGMPFSAAHVSA